MVNKYRRILAFLIDMLIVTSLAIFLSSNHLYNPYVYDIEEASKAYETLVPTTEDFESEERMKTFLNDASEKTYNLAHAQTYTYIWYLVFYILYFIVFAYYTEGQTIGKKLFKLKIVKSNDERIGIKELVLRFLTNGTSYFMGTNFYIILCLIGIFIFDGGMSFLIYSIIISIISFIIEMTNIFMYLFGNNQTCLNDKISGSKVIPVK